VSQPFAPDLVFVNSHAHPDSNAYTAFSFKIKPDISVYRRSDFIASKCISDSSLVEVIVEFKWLDRDDPFGDASGDGPINVASGGDPIHVASGGDPIHVASGGDPINVASGDDPFKEASGDDCLIEASGDDLLIEASGDDPLIEASEAIKEAQGFCRNADSAFDTLGQITSYAAAQLGSQFRTHAYSVLIVREGARILRWDRSGTVVTELIDYNTVPHLVEFFRRYSLAPPAMRGVDQSVSHPTPTEAAVARKSLGLGRTIPLVKLEIPRSDGYSYFITPTPIATPYTPPGRATRVFTAYDIAGERNVLLKDSWRVDLDDIQPEGVSYDILLKANVRNIPRCLASGDIGTDEYHATITKDYITAAWNSGSATHFVPHRHYRLVLDVIGRPLMGFNSSREMVTAVRDALIGEF
jgi:hypothetical protein